MSEAEAHYLRISAAHNEIARVARLRKMHAQHKFIREFQIACAPLIYRNDWESNKVNFMTKNRVAISEGSISKRIAAGGVGVLHALIYGNDWESKLNFMTENRAPFSNGSISERIAAGQGLYGDVMPLVGRDVKPIAPTMTRRARHRFKPRKLRMQRNTLEALAHRQNLLDAECRRFREAMEAQRTKRLGVAIEYTVPVFDEKGTTDLKWSFQLRLEAPAPTGAVSEFNRYVKPGTDWWNDVHDGRTWAYIKMLHQGEVAGTRALVTGVRNTPRRNSHFSGMSESRRRLCEKMSCVRWAGRDGSTRLSTEAQIVERCIRLYMVGCARVTGYVTPKQEMESDFVADPNLVNDARKRSAIFQKWTDREVHAYLCELLPAFNCDLHFDPLRREVVLPAVGLSNVFMEVAGIREGALPDSWESLVSWFFTNLVI